LSGLDAKVIASAAPARDWHWRLQAESGRALALAGQRQAGLDIIRAALPGLQAQGSASWVLRHYQGMVGAANPSNRDSTL
jgi:hypothetical protein